MDSEELDKLVNKFFRELQRMLNEIAKEIYSVTKKEIERELN